MRNNTGLKAAILTMSFIQMATNAMSSILVDIAESFPGTSVTTVQYLMTFPNLMIVGVSVVAAWLAEKISKRTLASLGLFFAAASGILSFAFHGSLVLLFVWAGLIGIGVGLVVPMANSLISDYFAGNERATMLGFQNGASNAGSMIMTYLGGVLSTIAWHYDFLVYLLAVPGLVLTLLFVPKQNVIGTEMDKAKIAGVKIAEAKTAEAKIIGAKDTYAQKRSYKLQKHEILYCVVAVAGILMFYLGPTNIAMYVSENQIGDSLTAGTAAAILLFGGVLMGLCFGKLAQKIGKHTITLGFLVLVAGFTLLCMTARIETTYIGCLLIGMSNPLIMPQCMGGVVSADKQRSTVMMSVVFAVANLGIFLAPGVTTISKIVMGDETASSRFAFAAVVTAVLTLVSFVWVQIAKRRKTDTGL